MKRALFPLIIAGLAVSAPAVAQNSGVDKRVERLEKEMRAVQRKVFPTGSKFFEAEIKPEQQKAGTSNSSSTPVSDLIARVDALERSLANITGQVEKNSFRLKQIEDKMAVSGTTNVVASSESSSTNSDSTGSEVKSSETKAPDPERVDAVAAVVMPETGDAAEDSYIYGYRLWDAKFYPEAQTQLKKTFETYPNHRRASFAQNLLGRAYLDDGKPALASVALYENYQKRPRGERAPDSLYFLSTALVQLDKKDDACRVLAELQDVYPEEASGRLSNRVSRGKSAANCK
ncbi:MAG: tol-pal system protein YbgF [Parasphingorhabdus sp.]